MIDENSDCVTKSKLANIMTGAVSQLNKQTNRLRDTETGKHLGRKHTKGRKRHTNRRTS